MRIFYFMEKYHFKNLSFDNIEGEVWNDVPGYDGVYQASNMGRVKSCERFDCKGRYRPAMIRKQTLTNMGILALPLSMDGKKKFHTVQSVVFCAFNGLKPTEEIKVGHKNKVLIDNRLSNLELQSQKSVVVESIRLGNMIPNPSIGRMAAERTEKAYAVFDIDENRRICTKCFQEKQLSDFHIRKTTCPSGRNRICADCKNKAGGVLDVGKNKYLKELALAGLKKCNKCGEVKEIEQFISESGARFFYCVSCMKARAKGVKKRFDELFELGLRNCTKCKTVKPFSDFNKLKTGRGGFGYVCKLCNKRSV